MTPMWEWPRALRWVALPIYLLLVGALKAVGLLLAALFSAFMQFLWELKEGFPPMVGWRMGWIWVRATWRGENVGEAVMAEVSRREGKPI